MCACVQLTVCVTLQVPDHLQTEQFVAPVTCCTLTLTAMMTPSSVSSGNSVTPWRTHRRTRARVHSAVTCHHWARDLQAYSNPAGSDSPNQAADGVTSRAAEKTQKQKTNRRFKKKPATENTQSYLKRERGQDDLQQHVRVGDLEQFAFTTEWMRPNASCFNTSTC